MKMDYRQVLIPIVNHRVTTECNRQMLDRGRAGALRMVEAKLGCDVESDGRPATEDRKLGSPVSSLRRP
ncbi:MAG: hypothetical protein RMM98_04385 [Acidobacteriota bacterium]|nr:hypothetical protein [Blastocatellia bacterium]MDW8238830.1 hypothetical protein [Acidobacteriota bacterium]